MLNTASYIKSAKGLRRAEITSFARGMSAKPDEGIMPLSYATSTYNFDYSDGALKEGLGLDEMYSLPNGEQIGGLFLYKRYDESANERDDRLMFFCESGNIYYRRLAGGGIEKLENIRLNSLPMALNYRLYSEDVAIICSESDNMLVWNGVDAPRFIENSPRISSMTLHYERLFVTVDGQKSSVWFSDDLDPTNFQISLAEGGFIEMQDERGQLNKVISYQNYIYIFREYGISRLTAYADQEEFTVSHLFVSGAKIYPKTVCLCGDRIIFLAQDGLYAFDGVSTYKISRQFDGLIEASESAYAAYNSGKYYCALKMRFNDGQAIGCEAGEYVNNTLLVLDISDSSYAIMRGADLRCLYGFMGEIVGGLRGDGRVGRISNCGRIYGDFTKKAWETPYTDFGYADRVKNLKSLHILSEFDSEVEIITDRGIKSFNIKGNSGISEIRCSAAFRQIKLRFTAKGERARIVKPTIIYSV